MNFNIVFLLLSYVSCYQQDYFQALADETDLRLSHDQMMEDKLRTIEDELKEIRIANQREKRGLKSNMISEREKDRKYRKLVRRVERRMQERMDEVLEQIQELVSGVAHDYDDSTEI